MRLLCAQQVLDAALDRPGVHLTRGQQTENGPGALVRRAGCTFVLAPRVVAVVALAPAAVGILPLLEPSHRALHGGIIGADAGVRQRGKHRPGAVYIVGPPTPEPRAVGFLLVAQIRDGAYQRPCVARAAGER